MDVVLFSVLRNSLNDAVSNCSGFIGKRKRDLVDICGIMKQAQEMAFTRTNIKSGFRRAHIWPVDSSEFLRAERPSDGTSSATILTIEQLQAAYEATRLQLRNATLILDARMLGCGYAESKNGWVMTSKTV